MTAAATCSLCIEHTVTQFHVDGMCCATEVQMLERRVGALSGVVSLEADVLTRQMRVHFDGAGVRPEHIAEVVAQAGMRAWPITTPAPAPHTASDRPWPLVAAALVCVAAGMLWIAGAPDPYVRGLLAVVIALTAPGTLRRALQAVRGRRLDIHVLMTLAVIGALTIDEWFEAATVLVLFGIAQALEARSLARARRAIGDVLTVAPSTADVVTDDRTETLPVERVPVGATVSVRPGGRVPLDGTVTAGTSTVNQAPVTGEAIPVLKTPGDLVYAGSVNGEGRLSVEVTRVAADSTVARIVHLVERAHAARAKVQSSIDRFAAVYTPVVLALAALLAVVPPLALDQPWGLWVERALVLLVIACPCALVIATPVAMVSALSGAARRGLLLKGGVVLERLAVVRIVALDKTGTVSEGRLEIAGVLPLGSLPMDEALRLAASVEAHVSHPLADAIVQRAQHAGITPLPAIEILSSPGLGASGLVDGRHVRVGRPGWVLHDRGREKGVPDATVLVSVDGEPVLALTAVDQPRGDAPDAIARIRSLIGEPVIVLSGDQEDAVATLSRSVGVSRWMSRLLPEEKAAAVESLSNEGDVLMVGDGINDGPALARAAVGLAVAGSGHAVALEAADGALMRHDLTLIAYAIALGRAALRTVRLNVALALAIKAAVIVAAATGAGSLWLAVMADVGASLLVVGLSLRLLRFDDRDAPMP